MREPTVAEESAVIRALKSWAVEAEKHDRQWKHIAEPVLPDIAPDDAALDAMLAMGNLRHGPPEPCKTDELLDADAARARGRNAGRGRAGRGRGGSGRNA